MRIILFKFEHRGNNILSIAIKALNFPWFYTVTFMLLFLYVMYFLYILIFC